MLGNKHSSEVIAKMRAKAITPERLAALKRVHENPEFQAKNLEHPVARGLESSGHRVKSS
jgi:hypothetical protein